MVKLYLVCSILVILLWLYIFYSINQEDVQYVPLSDEISGNNHLSIVQICIAAVLGFIWPVTVLLLLGLVVVRIIGRKYPRLMGRLEEEDE